MTLLTIVAGGPTAPSGVTTDEWSATVDSNTLRGIRCYPTTAGLHRYIFFVRGGGAGVASQLNDTEINSFLEKWPLLDDADQGEPTTGYYVFAPDIREGGGNWTGGEASTGDDEVGGADLEDIYQSFSLGQEFFNSGVPRCDSRKTTAVAFSTGALRLLMAMRNGGIRPECCVLRSPFCNIFDWDNIATASQDGLSAAMSPSISGGWTSVSETLKADLRRVERIALHDRSPVQWADELPDIPYCIIRAETDTTSIRAWTDALAGNLKDAGRHVEMHTVTGATHSFPESDSINMLNTIIRKFMAKHLAFSDGSA